MKLFSSIPNTWGIIMDQHYKFFEEKVLNTEMGRIRVDHLENDVTKALLNLFEHCRSVVLKSFLNLINVKDAPGSFEFAFQVTCCYLTSISLLKTVES
jgi:hypothetical protein